MFSLKKLVCVGVLALGSNAFAQTSMVGQAHDFSNDAWSGGRMCLPCHTPHHGMNDETGSAIGWLWNHELTTATYTLYDSSSQPAQNAFDKQSRLCMSCHDGTVAIDSFGGQVGNSFIGGGELIGTDLRDDHPVGAIATYPEAGNNDFNSAVNHNLGPNGELHLRALDIAGVQTYIVSCTTCHTPHYKGFAKQLRMSNTASAMCLSCHIK